MKENSRRPRWLRDLLVPALLAVLVFFILREPLAWWLHGEEIYDKEAIKEWVREARIYQTLPELAQRYQALHRRVAGLATEGGEPLHEQGTLREQLEYKRAEIREHLEALGIPPTKLHPGQLPLFPVIYRLKVNFDPELALESVAWDSQLPRHEGQVQVLTDIPLGQGASAEVQYHLHAYMQREFKERQDASKRFQLSGLAILLALGALGWVFVSQRREQQREQRRHQAEQQAARAEKLRLEEELRRREAERRHEDAERQNLELKSQLFANIGIMAGSYAHNIKNLLVRPNDLLRRCMEEHPDAGNQAQMIQEVRHTLGTVTQRLQQILQTVRRDPSQTIMVRLDLHALAADLERTWGDLAREKWKLTLRLEHDPASGDGQPLWIQGDLSHLQQALENLLFNARDATFEMRNHLREQARFAGGPGQLPPERRKALIAAAGWKGEVLLRTRKEGDQAILEVRDNGIGMSEEVRRRCTETHFSTKRDNALFAGLTAGMGLGLSFVQVILEHHRATLEIESGAGQGALFRLRFPAAG